MKAMKRLTLTVAVAVWTFLPSSAFADVRVSVQDGLVTVVAKDATVRQIMAEWARVGHAQIVNAERLTGGPMTIELTNMPEAQALDTLLRTAAGYLAAPRAVYAANLSRFDRIVVMATSSAPRATAPTPPTFQQPQFPQPQFTQPPVEDDQEEERQPPNPAMPNAPRGPVFNGAFPQPQIVNPQTGQPVMMPPGAQGALPAQQQQQVPQQPASFSMPTAPAGGGVAVPGMMVPVPQQQTGSPSQTPRKPGGQQQD